MESSFFFPFSLYILSVKTKQVTFSLENNRLMKNQNNFQFCFFICSVNLTTYIKYLRKQYSFRKKTLTLNQSKDALQRGLVSFMVSSLSTNFTELKNLKYIFIYNPKLKMNIQKKPQKEQQDPMQDYQQNPKLGMNKISQTSEYYIWRDPQQISQYCPSQPTQLKILKKTKSRMKSTYKTNYHTKNSYFELESTQANQSQILRQQNQELKKIIAELKLSSLYQFDHKKIKSLLIELDQLKKDLQKIKQENQKLKLENDFFKRANFQLKLENNKYKNERDQDTKQQYFRKSVKRLSSQQVKESMTKNILEDLQKYKIMGPITEKQENQLNQLRSSLTKLNTQRKSRSKDKASSIRRLKSQIYLNYPNKIEQKERIYKN